MVYQLCRVTYLAVLVAVLAATLAHPVPREEDRLALAVLIGLDVREIAATSGALWRAGRRSLQGWRQRRASEKEDSKKRSRPKVKAEPASNLAARLLPEPESKPWLEQAALALLKPGLRSLFDLVPEEACVTIYQQIRWLGGLCCPYCGCREVKVKDLHYREHWRRYSCPVCSQKAGHQVTFTDLNGSILEGSHLTVRQWLWAGLLFVAGETALGIKRELVISTRTAQRIVCLLQLVYFTRRFRSLLAGPVEIDEVYIIAGLKGRAGGLELERAPRKRGWKWPGRGTWETDKVPVLGLVDRQGAIYLIPLPNVQTATIQPFIEWLVKRGAKVYTDEYCIYQFLRRVGYQHETVNHSQGEYARGEVHVNTAEGLWNLLEEHLHKHHGVSKIYLPLYVARFEFLHNRRGQTDWSKLVDLLWLGVQADCRSLRQVIKEGTVKDLCLIPGVEVS
jgi:transposase-like protein